MRRSLVFGVFCFVILGSVASREHPPPPTVHQLECAVCSIVVEELEGIAAEGLEEKFIESYLFNNVCPKLSFDFKYVCDAIAGEWGAIVALLQKHATSADICAKELNLCTLSEPPKDGTPLPVVSVNLDVAAEERWAAIVNTTEYWDGLWRIADTLDAIIDDEVLTGFYDLVDLLWDVLPSPYKDEIGGISSVTGVPRGLVTLLNLFFEAKAGTPGCTSMTAQTASGEVLFARNQDLGFGVGFTDLLHNITIETHFTRGGKTVYQGVTFAGYVGLPTAFLKDGWALAENGRFFPGGPLGDLENVLYEVMHGGAHVTTWVVRDALEAGDTFEQAVKRLQTTPIAAECYYIIAGVSKGQGAVITRNMTDTVNTWMLGNTDHWNGGEPWFTIQTNYDPWKSAPWYDDRIHYANAAMKKLCGSADGTKPGNVTLDCMYQVLSTKPVLNIQTLYTAQAHPPTGEFISKKRWCPGDCVE